MLLSFFGYFFIYGKRSDAIVDGWLFLFGFGFYLRLIEFGINLVSPLRSHGVFKEDLLFEFVGECLIHDK